MNWDTHRDVFAAEVTQLASDFGRRATDPLIAQWWAALHDLTWDQFERGLRSMRRDADSFPRPIDLRRAVLSDHEQSEREKAAEQERRDLDAEMRAWKADPAKVAADKARFQRLRKHLASRLGTDGKRECSQEGCECCAFEKAHPHAHKHLRDGIVTADVEWSIPVEGCCSTISRTVNVTPIAAGPKPVPPAVPKGGGGDWLTRHQEEQEERDRRR